MDGWRGISLKGFNKCQRKKNEKRGVGVVVVGGEGLSSASNPLTATRGWRDEMAERME